MTRFEAQQRAWSQKALANTEAVLRGAIADLEELITRRQSSIKETGTYREGFVPVDTGELINSHIFRVNGVAVGSGEYAYEAGLAGMELGDTVEGVFTADHARPMEYGFTTRSGTRVPGRFYLRNGVQMWQTIVDQNARLFGD